MPRRRFCIKKHMNIADTERLGKELSAKEHWYINMSREIPWNHPLAAHDIQTWEL